MREVNFSIPNVNKASVGITTALYDRRALDCTSTLPLINSLNHLAYLTTSSARIRDILTVDGGVERLVCILKQGRDREVMEMWKWNLAFQCLVNIGVRGSESVRTRVVEADMVPVIATLLDNYVKIIDKLKEKSDATADRRHASGRHSTNRSSSTSSRRIASSQAGFDSSATLVDTPPPPPSTSHRRIASSQAGFDSSATLVDGAASSNSTSLSNSSRRHPPPPSISIPPAPSAASSRVRSRTQGHLDPEQDNGPSSPRSATLPRQPRHQHARSDGAMAQARSVGLPTINTQLITTDRGLRPIRDADRLPSMDTSGAASGATSQPESPTTPQAPVMQTTEIIEMERRERRIARNRYAQQQFRQQQRQRQQQQQQQPSNAADIEDGDADQSPAEMDQEPVAQNGEPMVDIQTADNMDGAAQTEAMLDTVTQQMDLTAAATAASETSEAEPFTMPHVPGQDGSIIATNIRPPANAMGTNLPPAPTQLATNMTSPLAAASATAAAAATHGRFILPSDTHAAVQAAMPRDEDVLMSLQLLAYVSKYCNLRTYFQSSHLVPKLKLGSIIELLDADGADVASIEQLAEAESEEEEYMLPDDVNIFPLVEKFTVRHHPNEMQYWAGVVMRNLCRKDDSRGGIRQCAYYKCGKWEKFPRQFAKCRRCRRTKYCSKECQKNAWVYHRHWCMVAN